MALVTTVLLVSAILTSCEAESEGNHVGKLRRSLGSLNLDVQFEWDEIVKRQLDESLHNDGAEVYNNNESRAQDRQRRQVRQFRPGSSTETHSCDVVSSVPNNLRTASGILPSGLDYFYQKYTHAYGIPIISSSSVSDSALQRACYVVRFLLADHSGVREWFYKLSGRLAVIGVNEQTTNIPEHSWLPDSSNSRTRGLGATEGIPISTAGEENLLCITAIDRYRNEDIFLHEVAHGIHVLGARFAIPGWEDRLQALYNQSLAAGRWYRTYAISNYAEYFAEGTQSYFDCNAYAFPFNGIHNNIDKRLKLFYYDRQLYDLIKEIFPCHNAYKQRCSSTRDEENNQLLRMNCDRGETTTQSTTSTLPSTTPASPKDCVDNHPYCAWWSEKGECNRNPGYMNSNCKESCNKCEDECTDTSPYCRRWAQIGECSRNPGYMLKSCTKSCNACVEVVSEKIFLDWINVTC